MSARSLSRNGGRAGETRREVEFAADAGLTVDEWLDGGRGGYSEAPRRRPQRDEAPVGRILDSLDKLGERIRSLSADRGDTSASSRTNATRRPELRPRAEPARYGAGRSQAALELDEAIEQIARKRDDLERNTPRRRSESEYAPRRFERDERSNPAPGSDIREHLRSLNAHADTTSNQLRALSDRLDMLRRNGGDAQCVADLREEVARLKQTLRSELNTRPLRDAERSYDDIVARLDHLQGAIENPHAVADLVHRLSDVRRLLTGLPTEAHMLAITDRLDSLAERVTRSEADGDALREMEHQMAALARAVAGLDQGAIIETVERRLADVNHQLVAVERKLGSFGGTERLHDDMGRQAAILSQVAQRSEQIPRVAHEMERQSASVDRIAKTVDALPHFAEAIERQAFAFDRMSRSVESLPNLASDLAAVRSNLDGGNGTVPFGLDVLVGRLDDLAKRIEQPGAAGPLADSVLGDRLTEILSRLDGLRGPQDAGAIADLESQFERLGRALEKRIERAADAAGLNGAVPAGMLEALGRIEAHIGLPPSEDRFEALSGRLDELTQLVKASRASIDVSAILEGIASLREEVAERAERASGGLDHELRGLADRIDRIALPSFDGAGLARLERQLADVVARMDARPDDTRVLADALARFEHTIERALSPELLAEYAARMAGSSRQEPNEGMAAALVQVQKDIAALQDDIRNNARRDREVMLALGDAVERLANRDEQATGAREPRGGGRDAQNWQAIEKTLADTISRRDGPAAEPPLDAREPARGRRANGDRRVEPTILAKKPAESAASSQNLNAPLEPGSGKPKARVADPRAAIVETHPAEEQTSREPTKADFIAAARRAAMSGQTDPRIPSRKARPALELESEATPSRFLSALRKHRLMLGVAAAVIIASITGVQLIKGVLATSGRETADVNDAAPSQPDVASADGGGTINLGAPAGKSRPVASAAMPDQVAMQSAPMGSLSTFSGGRDFSAAGSRDAATSDVGETLQASAPDADINARLSAGQNPVPKVLTGPAAPLPPDSMGPLALRKAAAAGDAVAQFDLAARLTEGRGTVQNLAEAVVWYERAAKSGLAPAQYRLASLFEKGQGVARNPEVAAKWYRSAAEVGNAKAMHNLAVMNAEGALGKPDYSAAATWFQKAADYGVRDSQYNLAILYARGLGVTRDLTSSYKWFALAAQAGDADAAKKRDDVAQVLDKDALARARLAVETWTRKEPARAANEVDLNNAVWRTAPPDETASAPTTDPILTAQKLLARRGYDIGSADGVMGKRTREAIIDFQRRAGLAETGEVDQRLIQALAERPL